jgi:hypothetical protein
MKKYTIEEAANLPVLKHGRHTNVHIHLIQLKIGEALLIEKGMDWLSKNPPYKVINAVTKKYNLKFEKGRSPDGKGWVAKRIA